MKHYGFTKANVRTMLDEANERIAMAAAGLGNKAFVKHAGRLGELNGFEVRQEWEKLYLFYHTQKRLALALLADIDNDDQSLCAKTAIS